MQKSLTCISKCLILFFTVHLCFSKTVLYDQSSDSYWELAPNQDFDDANAIPIGKNIRGKTNPYGEGHDFRYDIFSFSTDNDVMADVYLAEGQNYYKTNTLGLTIGSAATGNLITTIWTGDGSQTDRVALARGDYFVMVFCNSNGIGAYDYRFSIDFPQNNQSVSKPVSKTMLSSWAWLGQFPWVYDHSTESWFYYHFGVNICLVYDSRSGSWYTYDSGIRDWRPN